MISNQINIFYHSESLPYPFYQKHSIVLYKSNLRATNAYDSLRGNRCTQISALSIHMNVVELDNVSFYLEIRQEEKLK